MERLVIPLTPKGWKLARHLMQEGLVKDVGHLTNADWKKEVTTSDNVYRKVASRIHHPDYMVVGDKKEIEKICREYGVEALFEGMSNKENISLKE